MDLERVVIGIVVNGGEGKSKAMEAIAAAREGRIEEAEALLEQSDECIKKAHNVHGDYLTLESKGRESLLTIMMVHAQDHMMSAITVRDLAEEFVLMYKERRN